MADFPRRYGIYIADLNPTLGSGFARSDPSWWSAAMP